MTKSIRLEPLTKHAFAEFGDVIEKDGAENFEINSGLCTRFHDLAKIETTGPAAHPMISIASGKPYRLPLSLPMVERHPLGSQAFIPVSDNPFVVVVCKDNNGVPGEPRAFMTSNRQGINYRQNTWHGVLTPLNEVSDFLVVDRGGDGNNLEEHFFDEPYTLVDA